MKRLLALLLTLFFLAGCGQSPQVPKAGTAAPPVITLWHSYQGAALAGLQQVQQQLNKTNPGFRLELVYVPADQYAKRITEAQAADKGPDLFLVSQDQIPGLFLSGAIQPLDNLFDYNNYFKASIEGVTFSGSVMAVPQSIHVPVMATNRDLVSNPPTSLEQLISSAGRKFTAGLSGDLSDLYLTGALYSASGGKFYTADLKPTFNSPETLSFLQTIASLGSIKGGLYDPAASQAMMASGSVPFGLLDSGEISAYKALGKNLAFSALPGPGGKTGQNYVKVNGFVVSAKSAFVKQAIAAAVYLTSAQALSQYTIPMGEYPATPAAYDQDPLKASPEAQLVKNIAFTGTGYPLDQRVTTLMPILSQMIKDVLNGTDPAQAAQSGQDQALKALGAK